MRALALLSSLLLACGGSVLQNAPRPDPAVVAGMAAALAGASTLADPNAAARRSGEANKPSQELRPQKSGPLVPADVLDRLDEAAHD